MQNIPVRTAEGKRIRESLARRYGADGDVDYAAIEQQIVATELQGSDGDPYTRIAAVLHDVDTDAVSAEMRQDAKMRAYALLYGVTL